MASVPIWISLCHAQNQLINVAQSARFCSWHQLFCIFSASSPNNPPSGPSPSPSPLHLSPLPPSHFLSSNHPCTCALSCPFHLSPSTLHIFSCLLTTQAPAHSCACSPLPPCTSHPSTPLPVFWPPSHLRILMPLPFPLAVVIGVYTQVHLQLPHY